MKIKRAARVWLLGLFCSCLSGCSFSFCGFPIGSRDELVFTCEESVAADVVTEVGNEEAQAAAAEERGVSQDGKVNLNSAGKEELMTLNGIGETRAEAIIDYREQNGPFQKIEDIMQIPGIKEGIFSKIKEEIIVH